MITKKDKKRIIAEANKRIEQSWLISKSFTMGLPKSNELLKEDEPQATKGRDNEERLKQSINIDSIIKDKGVQKIINSLVADPKKLKKLTDEVIASGIDKSVLIQSVKNLKKGQPIDLLLKSEIDSIHENIRSKKFNPNFLKETEDEEFHDPRIDMFKHFEELDKKREEEKKEEAKFERKVTLLSGVIAGMLADLALIPLDTFEKHVELLYPVIGGIVVAAIVKTLGDKMGEKAALKDFQKKYREDQLNKNNEE